MPSVPKTSRFEFQVFAIPNSRHSALVAAHPQVSDAKTRLFERLLSDIELALEASILGSKAPMRVGAVKAPARSVSAGGHRRPPRGVARARVETDDDSEEESEDEDEDEKSHQRAGLRPLASRSSRVARGIVRPTSSADAKPTTNGHHIAASSSKQPQLTSSLRRGRSASPSSVAAKQRANPPLFAYATLFFLLNDFNCNAAAALFICIKN